MFADIGTFWETTLSALPAAAPGCHLDCGDGPVSQHDAERQAEHCRHAFRTRTTHAKSCSYLGRLEHAQYGQEPSLTVGSPSRPHDGGTVGIRARLTVGLGEARSRTALISATQTPPLATNPQVYYPRRWRRGRSITSRAPSASRWRTIASGYTRAGHGCGDDTSTITATSGRSFYGSLSAADA
jgi:hypothetical protein